MRTLATTKRRREFGEVGREYGSLSSTLVIYIILRGLSKNLKMQKKAWVSEEKRGALLMKVLLLDWTESIMTRSWPVPSKV